MLMANWPGSQPSKKIKPQNLRLYFYVLAKWTRLSIINKESIPFQLHLHLKVSYMSLGDDLIKMISKKFEPSTKISLRYKSFDLLLVTDKDGNAIQLFMGKENEKGLIKGDRYSRTLKYDRQGFLIKDHWERKGKAT